MSDLEKLGENRLNSTIAHPFNKESVERVMVVFRKGTFDKEWSAYGTVEFKNRNTSGEQRFDGATFDEVVAQIKSFLTHEL